MGTQFDSSCGPLAPRPATVIGWVSTVDQPPGMDWLSISTMAGKSALIASRMRMSTAFFACTERPGSHGGGQERLCSESIPSPSELNRLVSEAVL